MEAVSPEDPRVSALKAHNENTRNYQPWHERLLKLHSSKIEKLVGVNRPNLDVVEFGSGKFSSFSRRALKIAENHGRFTGIDLDPGFIKDAQKRILAYKKTGIPGAENIIVKQGNTNEPLAKYGITANTADVVVINSVAANASPAECDAIIVDLHNQIVEDPDNISARQALSFLESFRTRSIPSTFPDNLPMKGVNGNILLLVNAYLALKPGGRLVYAQNDQGLFHSATQEVRNLCERIGFDEKRTRTYDPLYNSLNVIDSFLARHSQYDIGIVTADKYK
jgi:SAM-dependent methyltransferase